jgi:hypothetical protein
MTALRFKGKFTREDVAKELSKVNSLIVGEILMHWGIRSGLFDFDGSDFTPHINRDSSS